MEISSMEGAFSTTLNDNSAPITTNNNTEIQNHLSTFGEREKSFTPIIPKPEVKIKKLDETKMITDSNENSLTVDTLIEILSSNGTNLPETSSSTSSSSKSKSNKTNNKKSSSSSSSNESNNSSSSKVMSKVKSESSSSSTTTTTSSVAIERSPSTTKNSNKSITSAKTTNSNSKLASPFGGKPTITDLNRKMRQAASTKRQPRTVYQSQISDNSVGIKICIKKSINSHKKVPSGTSSSSSSTKTSTTIKKRSRKSKLKERESDSEDGYVKKRKRVSFINNTNNKNEESSAVDGSEPIQEQSRWARELPKEILFDIFKLAVKSEGSIPTACRLARVCRVWRDVALDTKLWRKIDLSSYFKESSRTELRLKWFIENRMLDSEEIDIGFWKVTNTMCVLLKLVEYCPQLKSLSLAGWRALSADDLKYIAEKFPKIERLDLSSINTEMNTSKTAVGLQSLVNALEIIKDRLVHLNLAHNRLCGIPQITLALTANCPNLRLLDLSNVRTIAVSHGILHIEKLQEGCQKLKVLRIANSQIQLSTASLQEQMQSPGFPELEELSVASLADESRLMSDESLQRILKSSTKLKLLDVRGCVRLHHDSLIRIPAWDLKHLFLSGCSVTRDLGSGLELIASKWAHSLTEFDLAWASVQGPLDNALRALADKRDESPLNHLNLCGSAVSVEAVKEVLNNCPNLRSINLSSCRGLPRGIKRLLKGTEELKELRENLNEDS